MTPTAHDAAPATATDAAITTATPTSHEILMSVAMESTSAMHPVMEHAATSAATSTRSDTRAAGNVNEAEPAAATIAILTVTPAEGEQVNTHVNKPVVKSI